MCGADRSEQIAASLEKKVETERLHFQNGGQPTIGLEKRHNDALFIRRQPRVSAPRENGFSQKAIRDLRPALCIREYDLHSRPATCEHDGDPGYCGQHAPEDDEPAPAHPTALDWGADRRSRVANAKKNSKIANVSRERESLFRRSIFTNC